jgi:arylsulfatase A-like enzyme
MNRRDFLSLAGYSVGAAMMPAGWALGNSGGSMESRPNILLIMADDLGFSDLGCYGGEIETPHLDALARRGLRFSQFYNCAACVPTRGSMLTGLYPEQALNITTVKEEWDRGSEFRVSTPLRGDCVTFAEILKEAGYSTYMSGKWGLGHDLRYGPSARGFDRYFGLLSGASNYFEVSAGRAMALDWEPYTEPVGEDFYMTDAFTDYAVDFLNQHTEQERPDPFCLYLAYSSPHWPLHALPADIEKYRGRFMKGWDELREERYERMRGMGLMGDNATLPPRDERGLPWDDVFDKEAEDLKMAVYAAQVDRMDQGIGRVLKKIDEMGEEDNTLVLFLSDNGGAASNLYHRLEGAAAAGVAPGPAESFAAYGLPWGNLSNTPFRVFKSWVHEGGICSPMIAAWPGKIGSPGGITREPGHVMDVLPSLMEVGGGSYPTENDAGPITPIEGRSLIPTIGGKQRESHGMIAFHHGGNRALRMGDWKLVARSERDITHFHRWQYPAAPHEGGWELYDLVSDRTEMNDLAADNPKKVKEMVGHYESWLYRVGVKHEQS